jgi:hypothetical protein
VNYLACRFSALVIPELLGIGQRPILYLIVKRWPAPDVRSTILYHLPRSRRQPL